MNGANIFKTTLIVIITAIANILVIIATSIYFENFILGSWSDAVLITVGVVIANILIWPILTRFLMKFMILTFGIGALIINALIFYFITCLIPGVSVGSGEAFLIPLLMAIVTTLVSNLANIFYYESYTRRIANYVKRDNETHSKTYP